jgi:ribosomal protein S27AE
MGYLDTLRKLEQQRAIRASMQGRDLSHDLPSRSTPPSVTDSAAVVSDLNLTTSSPASTASGSHEPEYEKNELNEKRFSGRDPVPAPTGFCPTCGSGYWVRETREAAWTCGRCHPPRRPVDEALYSPGGSPPRPAPSRPSTAPADPVRCDPIPPRPVTWERADGSVCEGRAVLLAMEGEGPAAKFWIGIEMPDGGFSWVRDHRLRPPRRSK